MKNLNISNVAILRLVLLISSLMGGCGGGTAPVQPSLQSSPTAILYHLARKVEVCDLIRAILLGPSATRRPIASHNVEIASPTDDNLQTYAFAWDNVVFSPEIQLQYSVASFATPHYSGAVH